MFLWREQVGLYRIERENLFQWSEFDKVCFAMSLKLEHFFLQERVALVRACGGGGGAVGSFDHFANRGVSSPARISHLKRHACCIPKII